MEVQDERVEEVRNGFTVEGPGGVNFNVRVKGGRGRGKERNKNRCREK